MKLEVISMMLWKDVSPINNTKIIFGDFNQKLGIRKIRKGVTGGCSFYDASNDDDFIDYVCSRNLIHP